MSTAAATMTTTTTSSSSSSSSAAATATSRNDEPCAFAKLWGQLDGAPFHRYLTALPSTLGRGSNATEGAKKSDAFIDLGRSKALSREHATISWVPAKKAYQITCKSKNGMVVAGSYHAKGGTEKLDSRAAIKLGPASMYFLLPEREAPRARAPAPAPAPAVAPTVAPNNSQQATPSSQALPQPPPPPQENGIPAMLTPTPTPPPPSKVGRAPAAAAAPVAPPAVPAPVAPVAPAVPAVPAVPAAAAAAAAAAVARTTPISFRDMISWAFRSPQLSAVGAVNGLSSGDLQNWIMQAYPEWNTEGERMKALAVGIEDALTKNYVSIGGDRWAEPTPERLAKRAKLSVASDNGRTPAAPAAAAAAAAAAATTTTTAGTPAVTEGTAAAAAAAAAAMTVDVGGGDPVNGEGVSGAATTNAAGVPTQRNGFGMNG